ncbi:hypothetical protein T4B_13149 [Trichinella pseudospiralis]|uniref:Uncharacterized protein n=2 Tax=Trichinella pseudospiralis TaxID=6337 RepID=A0A0V1GZD8_TRIPS|nr:hypothetical protein T4B_13149 [Trichinella pseudospiralis]KRZ32908.1 hypothetical protein T4C_1989 [Trichinella pseudospiralis]
MSRMNRAPDGATDLFLHWRNAYSTPLDLLPGGSTSVNPTYPARRTEMLAAKSLSFEGYFREFCSRTVTNSHTPDKGPVTVVSSLVDNADPKAGTVQPKIGFSGSI